MINVGIDVDGVLRDFQLKVKQMAKDKFNIDYSGKYWSEMFELDAKGRSLGSWVFKEWAEEVFTTAPAIEENLISYNKFVNNPNLNVYIVTTQSKKHEDYTTRWLEKNGVEGYESVYFLKDKTKAPCNVLIDDKLENIKSYIKASRMGILVDRPWNQHEKVLYRVPNLKKAYTILLPYL